MECIAIHNFLFVNIDANPVLHLASAIIFYKGNLVDWNHLILDICRRIVFFFHSLKSYTANSILVYSITEYCSTSTVHATTYNWHTSVWPQGVDHYSLSFITITAIPMLN